MPSLIPRSGYCLVEPIPESDSTIVIPDVARADLQSQFKVIANGKGKIVKLKKGTFLRLNPEFGVGDRIVANRYAGREVPCDGKRMRLIEHASVMAVISTPS